MNTSWKQGEIGELTTLVKDGTHGTHKDVDDGIPLLSAKDINNGKVSIPQDCRRISEKDFKQIHSNYSIQKGDILITLVGSIGRLAIVQDYSNDFTLQRSVGILRFNEKLDKRYAYYYLASPEFQNHLMLSVNASAQGGVYLGTLSKLRINYSPDITNQRKIAKILNRVDAVIENTEAAIAKYKALKQGMMQDLFTRGIDLKTGKLRSSQKDAPELYKETELGWIPKDWELKRIMNLAKINGRVGWKGYTVEDLRDEGPLTIGAGQIDKNNKLTLENSVHLSHEKFKESPEIMVKKGDILIVQRGTIGKYVIIDKEIGEATINPSMVLLNNLKCNPHFLYYSLGTNFILKQIENSTSQTGVPMISQHQVKNFQIVFPSDPEELSHLTEKIFQIDQLLEKEEANLSKHQSLKKGLMQDLLTGKVEVKV